MSRWRLRRTRARMDFEWCFGTFVPCFGGQTTKGGQEPAKHGIDHTPDPVAMQWPCLPEHKLRTLRTRSVRRASGFVQTPIKEVAEHGSSQMKCTVGFSDRCPRLNWPPGPPTRATQPHIRPIGADSDGHRSSFTPARQGAFNPAQARNLKAPPERVCFLGGAWRETEWFPDWPSSPRQGPVTEPSEKE